MRPPADFDPTGSMIRLFDGSGNVISQFHPNYTNVLQDIRFGAGGYNPDPTRRGSSGGLYANAGSETWAKNRDRYKAMWDAREAARYDWIGGVIARLVLYICGKLHCKSETGDDAIDEAYDGYLHGWCGDERMDDGTTRCDITGRHRFLKQVQMAMSAFFIDGDHGFVEIAPKESPTGGFCLQNIEADRIGSPHEATTLNNYIGGITFDELTGRIQTYRVFRRTRTNQYVDQRDIEIGNFIHFFDPEWSDEYRSPTKLMRGLNDLRDIREWIEAEKSAGKTQAQWAAMVGTKDPFNNTGPAAWTGKTANGTPTQAAEWGKILKMAEGENFSMLSPSARPSGAFMSFIETLIRKLSITLGVSYGLLWDLASLGGAMARIEVQADLRKIQYWQELLKNLILDRVRQKVLAEGIYLNAIPAHPNWKKCTWNFGAHITADLGYEMEADISAIDHGIISTPEVMAKHGRTPRDVFTANASVANTALNVAREQAIPVETFAKGLYPDITRQKAAFDTPTPLPPPPAGSIDAIGDKGVAKLLELLEKVGEGKIDRESGIEAAIRVFGLTRSQAEKIIPDEPSEADLNREAGLDAKGRHAPVVAGPKTSSSKKPTAKKKISK